MELWMVASSSKDDARDEVDQNARRRAIEAQHAAMATTGTAAGAVRPRIRFHMLVALTFAVGG